ncbi:unnamed protein product, partial [Choristocarpus tenellus]
MMEDCHAGEEREEGSWGRACDRAAYLEGVLSQALAASTKYSIGEGREMGLIDQIPVASENMSFSSFFMDYAVGGRPIILLEDLINTSDHSVNEVGDVSLGTGEEAASSSSSSASPSLPPSMPISAGTDHVLELLLSCVRYENPRVDTAEQLLSSCDKSLLEAIVTPSYASADFVQRYQEPDVLPLEKHQAVRKYLSRWTTLHRVRPGGSTPVNTCPSGANMLVAVLSGKLDVMVFNTEALPSLQPVFGSPC